MCVSVCVCVCVCMCACAFFLSDDISVERLSYHTICWTINVWTLCLLWKNTAVINCHVWCKCTCLICNIHVMTSGYNLSSGVDFKYMYLCKWGFVVPSKGTLVCSQNRSASSLQKFHSQFITIHFSPTRVKTINSNPTSRPASPYSRIPLHNK